MLVRGETRREGDETFSVVLSDAFGAALDDSLGMGIIMNDD